MKSFFLGFLFLFSIFSGMQAQVLNVTATVNYKYLPTDEQDDLAGLADKIERYYNGYSWVEDQFGYDVDCKINIIIETVQKKSSEKIYKAQFLISSSSGENFYDKTWRFTYNQSSPLSHNAVQFDPLTKLLDFYAYMVLAGELDTNGLLLGNPLYEKAMDIANQGKMSRYNRGWNDRMNEVQRITNLRTRPLRKVKPLFFDALDYFEQDSLKKAYQDAKVVLDGIAKTYNAQPNNHYLQYFFKAHYKDLAQLFAGHNDALEKLVTFDSKHRETYRKFMEKE